MRIALKRIIAAVIFTLSLNSLYAAEAYEFFEEAVDGGSNKKEIVASQIETEEGVSFIISLSKEGAKYTLLSYGTNFVSFEEIAEDETRLRFLFTAVSHGKSEIRIAKTKDSYTEAEIVYPVLINPSAERIASKKTQEQEKKSEKTEEKKESQSEEIKLYTVALKLFDSKVYDEAKKGFEKVISQYPLTEYGARAIARLGDIEYIQSNYSSARDTYERIKTSVSAPMDVLAYGSYRVGSSLSALGNKEEALSAFFYTEEFYPQSPYAACALYEASEVLVFLNRKNEAASLMEKAIENYPSFEKRANTIYALASLYDKGGKEIRNLSKAHAFYAKYLEEFPFASKSKDADERKKYLEKNFINVR